MKYNDLYVLGVDEMVIGKLMLRKYGMGISTVWYGNIYRLVWGCLLNATDSAQ